MSERAYPHSLEAERSVLGAVLLDNALYDDAAVQLPEPDAFFRHGHRVVWETMGRLRADGTPIDFGTLREALGPSKIEDAGGVAYLASLVDGVPRAVNVAFYARTVRDKAMLRALIRQSEALIARAQTSTDDAEDVLEHAERAILALSMASQPGEWVLAGEWFAQMAKRVEAAASRPRGLTGVTTGLVGLDQITRGLQRSELVIIGARPSVGKTSLMLQLVRQAANAGMVGLFSLEMSREAIGYRAISQESGIGAYHLMSGYVPSTDQRKIAASLDALGSLPIAIDDSAGMTPGSIRAKARRLRARYGAISALFIDYLQLLYGGSTSRHQNRTQELGEIAKSLKDLAKELECPVVVLSQLTREADKGGAPKLWHLRESGDIEAAADLVILMHRPGQHEEGKAYGDREEAHLIVAKQRNGPTGLVRAQWQAQTMRFIDAPEDAQGAA